LGEALARGREESKNTGAPFTSDEHEFGTSVDGEVARNVGFSY
jgi:hypothetical protein